MGIIRDIFGIRKKYFNFQAGVYLDETTKKPVQGEITSLLRWYEKKTMYAYTERGALKLFMNYMETKYPELKGYFWYF